MAPHRVRCVCVCCVGVFSPPAQCICVSGRVHVQGRGPSALNVALDYILETSVVLEAGFITSSSNWSSILQPRCVSWLSDKTNRKQSQRFEKEKTLFTKCVMNCDYGPLMSYYSRAEGQQRYDVTPHVSLPRTTKA